MQNNIIFEVTFSDVFLFKLTFRSPVREASSEQQRISYLQERKWTSKKNIGNQEHKLSWRNKQKINNVRYYNM